MSARGWWRLFMYGPGAVMVGVGLFLFFLGDPGEVAWLAFAMAGVTLFLTTRCLPPAFRSGYWRGRTEAVTELTRTGMVRDLSDLPEPDLWDEGWWGETAAWVRRVESEGR